MEIEVLAIEIQQEPIELCKLLKIANLVSGGGEAKMVISEGYVYLNGEVEYQKRKKIYFEDIVQFDGEAVMPILAEETPAVEEDTVIQEQQAVSQVEEDNQASNSDGAFFSPYEQSIDTNQFEEPAKESARNKSSSKTPNSKGASDKSSAKASAHSKAKSKANKGSKSSKVKQPNKGKVVEEDKSKNKINPRSGRKSISF